MHAQRLGGTYWSTTLKKTLICAALYFLGVGAFAEPVWHCSKTEATNTAEASGAENQFSIASIISNPEVIGVSIRDLIDIYSGIPVQLAGVPLSACFWVGNDELSQEALGSLGLNPASIYSLIRRSTIIQNHLHPVKNPDEMAQCISKHSPAVGYLPNSSETDLIAPCF